MEGDRGGRFSEARGNWPRHWPIGPVDSTIGLKNTEAFVAARRSLYLSPVEPYLANLKDFLLNKMGMLVDTVANLSISNIRKIHPRKMPSHRKNTDVTKKCMFRSEIHKSVKWSLAMLATWNKTINWT